MNQSQPEAGAAAVPKTEFAGNDVTEIPDHELLRKIGGGSYGEVWLARNALGTYRAIKVVYRRNFAHERPFEREFSGIQKYEPISRSQGGLMDILQVGRNGQAQYFYYVMELADDVDSGTVINPESYTPRTLAYERSQRDHLPFDQCLSIGLALSSALAILHKHGLVHRDVKPSNVVFVNGVPELADIGLVTDIEEARSYVGTEGFIPPEGPGTPQADIYSLGKVLYEISTGKDRQDYPELPMPFGDTETQAELLELNEIVIKACRADVRQRYQTAEQLHADLALLQRGRSIKQVRKLRKRLAFATKAGMAAVAVALVATGAWLGSVKQIRRARQAERKAQAAADFLNQLFVGVQPSVAQGREAALLKDIRGVAENLPGVWGSLDCILDGVPIKNMAQYRGRTSLMNVAFSASNSSNILGVSTPEPMPYLSVADGFYAFFFPLPIGMHTMEFGGVFYTVTVSPR